MIDAGWAAVLGAGIGAVAGVGGVMIGKEIDGRQADATWKREQRAKAYAGLISAAEAVFGEILEDPDTFDAAQFRSCFRELTRADALINIFADEPAVRASHRVWNFVARLDDDELVALPDGPEWQGISAEFRRRLEAFINVARTDLGFLEVEGATEELDESSRTR